jgi:hypothetical protein
MSRENDPHPEPVDLRGECTRPARLGYAVEGLVETAGTVHFGDARKSSLLEGIEQDHLPLNELDELEEKVSALFRGGITELIIEKRLDDIPGWTSLGKGLPGVIREYRKKDCGAPDVTERQVEKEPVVDLVPERNLVPIRAVMMSTQAAASGEEMRIRTFWLPKART